MSLKQKIRVFLVGNDPVIDWKVQATTWFSILLGCVCMSIGFTIFINPYNIVPGGVYGLSIVMHNIFPSVQVGYFGYMFDIPLLITSMVMLGSKFGGRTIVSGIAQSYPEPEKLVGMQVCFIANFPPRKLKGVESQGMILSAVDADGKLVLVTPSRAVKNGANVG